MRKKLFNNIKKPKFAPSTCVYEGHNAPSWMLVRFL